MYVYKCYKYFCDHCNCYRGTESLSATLGLVDQTILKLSGKGNEGQFPGNRGRDAQNIRTTLSGEEEKLECYIYNKIKQKALSLGAGLEN